MKEINLKDYPTLFKLFTLDSVIPANTLVKDTVTGETINLNDLICDAINDFEFLCEDLEK